MCLQLSTRALSSSAHGFLSRVSFDALIVCKGQESGCLFHPGFAKVRALKVEAGGATGHELQSTGSFL